MTYTVVIADDDKLICKGISMLLTQKYPDIKICGVFYNGIDLYDYLRNHPVDIIITDIQMHGHTGLEIAQYIKKPCPKPLSF